LAVCLRYGATPMPVASTMKVSIATNVADDRDLWPLNGLRHPPRGDTTGWYLWAGEVLRGDPDFFVPTHAVHLTEYRPICSPYLALPPGWRFLLAPGYEDVWYDESLLITD
jgi:hypothetical protein